MFEAFAHKYLSRWCYCCRSSGRELACVRSVEEKCPVRIMKQNDPYIRHIINVFYINCCREAYITPLDSTCYSFSEVAAASLARVDTLRLCLLLNVFMKYNEWLTYYITPSTGINIQSEDTDTSNSYTVIPSCIRYIPKDILQSHSINVTLCTHIPGKTSWSPTSGVTSVWSPVY